MQFFHKIFSWYFSKNALPYWCVLAIDSCIILFAEMLAVSFSTSADYIVQKYKSILLFNMTSLPTMWLGMRIFHTYSGILRYSSLVDLAKVVYAVVTGQILFIAICYIHEQLGVIPQILEFKTGLLAILFSVTCMGGLRIIVKCIYDTTISNKRIRNAIVYGVRQGGIALATSIRNEHPKKYIVKGFVTTEESMYDRYLLGTQVHSIESIKKYIKTSNNIDVIFVSPIVAEEFRENTDFINFITKQDIKILMMSSAECWDGKSELKHEQLHEVEIEDLLPRYQITVDLDAIGKLLNGKRILITGAAGSIGFEMVRQVAQFSPSELILVDQAETPMHDVRLYMQRNHPDIAAPTIVGSISNPTHMEEIFSKHRPEYVFHAAAYKHVPMMEDNPAMAIQNNTYGTRVIADLAVKYGTKKFVMISTDKAVNPSNVMGCSKRICEIYCQALNKKLWEETQQTGKPTTQFITTRFGNVLGSNGSVIPIFREQIRKGGPVTVTHPDIIRFFMLIPEACQLVLEAGTMGKGGEIFIFDMGKPVRIADLAQRMIDLSGAKKVEVKFTGLRDGEKLYEEVLNDAEQTIPTNHPKIKVAKVREYPYDEALRNEEELYQLSFTYDDMAIVKKMKEIVPEYKSQQSKYQVLDK